jgi:hypothetical protein
MIEENCANCKYIKISGDGDQGYCRRFPPVFIFEHDNLDKDDETFKESYAWQQPVVHDDDLCGEWKAKA